MSQSQSGAALVGLITLAVAGTATALSIRTAAIAGGPRTRAKISESPVDTTITAGPKPTLREMRATHSSGASIPVGFASSAG
jgi:hypothetical protein